MHSRLIPAVHNFGGFMPTTIGSANGIVRDLDWVQHSFMLAGERVELSKDLVRYRNLSSADFKYTATGFGESIILNPAPQRFTCMMFNYMIIETIIIESTYP
jgi:hypothetical protein